MPDKNDKEKRYYICDPDKNVMCSKTNCKRNGGRCQYTANKDFAASWGRNGTLLEMTRRDT